MVCKGGGCRSLSKKKMLRGKLGRMESYFTLGLALSAAAR